MSDESEYDVEPEEFDIYKRKYQLLLDRCEVLQQVLILIFCIPYNNLIMENKIIHSLIIGK